MPNQSTGPTQQTRCTTQDCRPDQYGWRSESAPFDLLVILIVLCLVVAAWASLRGADPPKEGEADDP